MAEFKVSVQRWPGGVSTFAGGTRTAIKVDRPWQKTMEIDPRVCPFEPERLYAKHEIVLRSEDGEWVAFKNLSTPNQYHRVIVPTTCEEWPDARLRQLGGRVEIAKALDLSYQTLGLNAHVYREQEHIVSHNGYTGGQNQPHIHWHAVVFPEVAQGKHPYEIQRELLEITADPSFFVMTHGNLKVVAGGHRAGQCIILPNDPEPLVSLENIVNVLDPLVTLFANKFRSRVGEKLPPDFTFDLVFVRGQFAYGLYVPILNHIGSTEFAGIMGQQAMTLPWPHEMSAAYLRGEVEL